MRGGQHYSSLHIARCLTTKTRIDAETETLIPTIGGVFVDVPIAFDSRQECVSSTDVFGALSSSSPQAQAVSYAIQAGALRTNPNSGPDGVGVQANVAYTLEARAEVQCAQYGMAVRRLTPRECERLQGFPDDYTMIPTKKISAKRAEKLQALGELVLVIDNHPWEMAADGPRYKALGNSWAVPNVVWLGNRINQALRATYRAAA